MQNATSLRLLLLFVLLVPAPVFAQEATVTTAGPIYLLPDADRIPLRTAAPNTRLRVLEEAPDGWVKVEFRDPQFGVRTGYIEARHLRIHRPELEPIDLSIGREPALKPVPADEAFQPAPVYEPQLAGRRFARGWIDVNVGFAVAGEPGFGTVYEPVLFDEVARVSADYHSPAGAEFDFGGGFMFTPAFGLGASFAGTAHEDHAELAISIPHPRFANAYASDSGPTEEKLMRIESSASFHAMFASHISDRVTLRFFAGPSYFRIRQEAVGLIRYDQAFLFFSPANAVAITGYEPSLIDFDENGGWGFHAGGDVSVFFTRVVGIGAFGKFSRGRVEILDPLSGKDVDVTTGGFQTGGGLRLRF